MTEGIIQRVINKYIVNTELQYESKNVAYKIEQELIEEIKKISTTRDAYGGIWLVCDQSKLIGDSE